KQFVYWSKTKVYLFDQQQYIIYSAPGDVMAVAQFNDTWRVVRVCDTATIEIGNLKGSFNNCSNGEKWWDSRRTFSYTVHESPVSAIAFSPDGKRVASSSEDLTIQIWNTQDSEVFTFGVHPVPPSLLSWSPNGKYVCSADTEGIVLVWLAA